MHLLIRIFTISLFFTACFLTAAEQATQPADPEVSDAYKKIYGESIQAFNEGNFNLALTKINEADKAQPGVAAGMNLRGAILVKLKEVDQAIVLFKELVKLEPNNQVPLFNLGEAYFLKKDYLESKKHFNQFLALPNNAENSLGKYKVFLCDMMLGNKAEVDKVINELTPTISNPYYYFANAAVNFQKGDKVKGRDWVQSAYSIYPPDLNANFADSFIEFGWLTTEDVGQSSSIASNDLKSLSKEFKAPKVSKTGNSAIDTGFAPAALDSLLPNLVEKKEKDEKPAKEVKK